MRSHRECKTHKQTIRQTLRNNECERRTQNHHQVTITKQTHETRWANQMQAYDSAFRHFGAHRGYAFGSTLVYTSVRIVFYTFGRRNDLAAALST